MIKLKNKTLHYKKTLRESFLFEYTRKVKIKKGHRSDLYGLEQFIDHRILHSWKISLFNKRLFHATNFKSTAFSGQLNLVTLMMAQCFVPRQAQITFNHQIIGLIAHSLPTISRKHWGFIKSLPLTIRLLSHTMMVVVKPGQKDTSSFNFFSF